MSPLPEAAAIANAPLRRVEDVIRLFEALAAAEHARRRPPPALALQPVSALLARIGDPHRNLQCIHIAGSKGKGSTALLCESILGAAGLRVGTYTSPHLQRWSERFRVGGSEVDDARLVDAAEWLRPHLAALLDCPHPPGFFDFLTATALALFAQAQVDVAVIEVGLGGRLDATNIVRPLVTCITSIELEHTERLGTTLAAIAGEKAGIIKPGVPVVIGNLPDDAITAVRARAFQCAAPLQRLGDEFAAHVVSASADGLNLSVRSRQLALDLTIPVLGPHLAGNAALALACVQHSGLLTPQRLADAALRGLERGALPGRTEILRRGPWVVADGAHTPSSARALVDSLDRLNCRERHMVISVSAGKDLSTLMPILSSGASAIIATRADRQRSVAPTAIADWAGIHLPRMPIHVIDDPHQAVQATYSRLASHALMCVTGSVYAAGAAKAAFA